MPGFPPPAVRERFVGSGPARLYVRDIGSAGGAPIIVVHGGPDFSHDYLAPELDRLAEWFRLVYYDQRGRGRSFSGQRADDVTAAGEVDDLDRVRASLGRGRRSVAVLGHSWGGLLAMEYAIRHPDRVSHLVLVDTAPASHADSVVVREAVRRRRTPEESAELVRLAAEPGYREGDLDAEAAYYRVHFGAALRDPQLLDDVLRRLRSGWTSDGVLAARAIEHRLYEQTWESEGYDLFPELRRLRIPTLVVHGEHDFIPVEVARRIADAVPDARLVVLPDCGHFAYLEQPGRVCTTIRAFLAPSGQGTSMSSNGVL